DRYGAAPGSGAVGDRGPYLDHVARRDLPDPALLTGGGVEGDDRVRARPGRLRVVVPRREVHEAEVGVVRRRRPDADAVERRLGGAVAPQLVAAAAVERGRAP